MKRSKFLLIFYFPSSTSCVERAFCNLNNFIPQRIAICYVRTRTNYLLIAECNIGPFLQNGIGHAALTQFLLPPWDLFERQHHDYDSF